MAHAWVWGSEATRRSWLSPFPMRGLRIKLVFRLGSSNRYFHRPNNWLFQSCTIWSQYVRNRAYPAACYAGRLSIGEDFCGYSIPQAFSCCLQMMLIWGLEAETGPCCERPRRKRHKIKAPHVTTTMAFCGKPIIYNVDVSVLPSCASSVRSYPSRTLSACFHTQSISQGS